ncbi:uncharacterized protein I206_104320 [Kwoniella pini CBS 10737]|uniref:Uncharacterized protein n=1 Tax=Kwoniella pini CBS 10737 TaxID=1296096 RepID=A0A1B9I203_9TREE|nr:uncharacterized protein I206_04102 [Kwoniella pini CBS 10737]OCF49580.1 hypothetical protein I206_04102 [Kwoniella pini CBS 10737]
MVYSSKSSILLSITIQLLSLSLIQATPSSKWTDNISVEREEILGSAVKSNLVKRASGYTNPADDGGYMLTIVNGTYPAGLGEPLNVILSADSDKAVLAKSLDDGGFLNYMLIAGQGEECLGQHLGSDQSANLGDGKGNVTEVEELRYNYGNPYIGTCQETFNGGLHLRYWIQNTTNAYFMAVSVEMDLNSGHDIVPNGYNIGRDQLIGNLTGQAINTSALTNTSTFSGTGSYSNYTYQTDVQYVSGLLRNSSDDINHYITVEENGLPAIDGLVAVLTVKITAKPQSSGAWLTVSQIPLISVLLPLLLSSILALF